MGNSKEIENVNTYKPIEVYKNEIELYLDEYINTQLIHPEDIYKPMVFNGAIKYIYLHVFKIYDDKLKQNKNNVDYNDIGLIEKLWDIFIGLCSKYNKNPTLEKFCIMTGLTPQLLQEWRKDERNCNEKRRLLVLKMLSECESSLVDKTVEENGIGSMFLLKARYNYRDNQNIVIETQKLDKIETPEQIAAKHATAVLPEKPDF